MSDPTPDDEPTSLRVLNLTARNVMGVRAVDITPAAGEPVVLVTGANGAGKSSVLEAIWLALGGRAAAKDVAHPIRDGETTAEVRLDLGDIIVTRTWTRGGAHAGTLTVVNAEGTTFKAPQALLDSMLGRLSFDPLAYAGKDARTQANELAALLDLGEFDWTAHVAERERVFSKRTEVGRDARATEARLEPLPAPDPELPTEEVSIVGLTQEWTTAQAEATRLDGLQAEVDRMNARAAQLREAQAAATEALEQRIADLRAEHERISAEQLAEAGRLEGAADAALGDLARSERPDVAAITARVTEAEQLNQAVRAAADFRRLSAEAKDLRTEFATLTARLDEMDATRDTAIAAADMPLPGLRFNEDGVLFDARGDGVLVPLKDCSSAEQLRVSVAMAMAANPAIRIIRITDGSLLDPESLAMISAMAADRGYQVWVEQVDVSGQVGIVIEDGTVRDAP